MINEMKKLTDKTLTKVILWLICGSFVFIGFTSNFLIGDQTALIIAKQKVDIYELDNELSRQLNFIKKQTGGKISPALKKGFLSQVINNLVFRILLDTDIKNKAIPVSNEKIYEIVKATKEFQDDKGNFSQKLFEYILKANGVSEPNFIAEIANQTARDLFVNTLTAYVDNSNIAKINYKLNNEKRVFDYISLNVKNETITTKPTDNELQETYKINIEKFQIPEYRQISYFLITPETAKNYKNIVSNDEAKISKTMLDIAENIIDDIYGGISIKDIENSFHIKQTTLPFIDKEGIQKNKQKLSNNVLTQKNRDIAFFALDEKGVSDIIEDKNNLLILMVNKVEAAKPKDFQVVKNEVHNIWLQNEKEKNATTKVQNILKELKSGKTLDSFNLKVNKNLTISKQDKNYDYNFIVKLFDATKNESVVNKENNTWQIAVIKDIIIPEIKDTKDFEKYQAQEKSKFTNLVLDDYIAFLQNKYTVKVNQKVIERLVK